MLLKTIGPSEVRQGVVAKKPRARSMFPGALQPSMRTGVAGLSEQFADQFVEVLEQCYRFLFGANAASSVEGSSKLVRLLELLKDAIVDSGASLGRHP